jgi:hypothetical protein
MIPNNTGKTQTVTDCHPINYVIHAVKLCDPGYHFLGNDSKYHFLTENSKGNPCCAENFIERKNMKKTALYT